MLIVQRQDRLLDLLRQRRAASLDELSSELGVSSSTVRRDLEALEAKGLVDRTHGGAVIREREQPTDSPRPAPTVALATRMTEQVDAKRAIGKRAAAMVESSMTVLLDGGSTVIMAAREIAARPLQVVTTSLTIAQHFKDDEDVELILAGGTLYPRTEVFTGQLTRSALEQLHADVLFTSMAGIYDDDVYNINLAMARTEQVMMRQTTRRVLLMDSAKFGRRSLVKVGPLDAFDHVITDAGVPDEYRDRLGDRLIVA